MNCGDISRYIESFLQVDSPEGKGRSLRLNHDLPKDVSGYISGKSNGVFLWAVFVTRLLLESVFLHHRAFNRVQRIEEIPEELDILLQLALESVDLSRQEKMAGALTIARNAGQSLPAELFFSIIWSIMMVCSYFINSQNFCHQIANKFKSSILPCISISNEYAKVCWKSVSGRWFLCIEWSLN
jgi:hypothetical protein